MSTIVSFTKNLRDNEMSLLEIQANLTHTIETKFNFLHLGKLTQIDQVIDTFHDRIITCSTLAIIRYLGKE